MVWAEIARLALSRAGAHRGLGRDTAEQLQGQAGTLSSPK